MKRILLTATVIALSGSTVGASVINVNIFGFGGPKTGVFLDGTGWSAGFTPIPYFGSTWNDLSGAVTAADLQDSEGVASGIGLIMLNPSNNSQPAFTWSLEGGPLVPGDDIIDNFLTANNGFGPPLNGPMILSISGLDTNKTYDFHFVSQGDADGRGGTFTIQGITNTTDGLGKTGPLVEGVNYASFTDVTPTNSTMEVVLAAGPGSASWALLNGFQINVIEDAPDLLPPTGLTATAGDLQVDLAWTPEPNAQSYSVYRSEANTTASFVSIASNVVTSSYTDSAGLVANTRYYYVVTSVSNAVESLFSQLASAIPFDTSDMEAPAAPTMLSAFIANSVTVLLDWDDNAEVDFSEYTVYRAVTGEAVFSNVATTANSDYIDTAPSSEVSYDYKVSATDIAGNESALSAGATADLKSRYIIEGEDFVEGAGVGTETTFDLGGGINIGYIDPGEFTTYLVDLPIAGEYRIDLRVARAQPGNTLVDISLGAITNSLASVVVPDTGNWQAWQTVSTSVTFPVAGMQTLRLSYNGGMNLNWFELISPPVGPEIALAIANGEVILAWDGKAFKLYDVEETTDLAATPVSWDPLPSLTNLPGMVGSMVVTATVASADFAAYRVLQSDVPVIVLLNDDFEGMTTNTTDWTLGTDGDPGTAWELGTPSSGPGAANSGTNCWATNLGGNHGLNADVWLRTPVIDLTGAGNASLRFSQYTDIDTDGLDIDTAIVSVLDTNLAVLAELSNSDQNISPWTETELSLPLAVLDQQVIIEFRFTSDSFGSFPGWYIDDVSVTVP